MKGLKFLTWCILGAAIADEERKREEEKQKKTRRIVIEIKEE